MQEVLSQLEGFIDAKADLEQYVTHPKIAVDWLSNHKEDFVGKHVLDLGCGTGMLGILAGLLGASKVTFLDIDKDALEVCKRNLKEVDFSYEIVHRPLMSIDADVVVMNPPFGTKNRHADKQFVIASCLSAPVVHSMHLAGSEEFIAQVASEYGHVMSHHRLFRFVLDNTMPMHTQHQKNIDVVTVRLTQQDL